MRRSVSRPTSTYSRGARKRKPRKAALSAKTKAAPDDLPRRGFVASIRRHLTARRLSPTLASVGSGISLRFPVLALVMIGVGPLMREEVFLHLVDDATCDLALTASIPAAQEQRSVACSTCPDQRLILQVNQSDAPFVLVRDSESSVMPLLIAFYKGPGKDVIRFFHIRYDNDRQFLFHDLRRNKRMQIPLHRRDENLRAGQRGFYRFVLGDGLGESSSDKRQDSKQ